MNASARLTRTEFDVALLSASAELEARLPRLEALEQARKVIIYSYGSKGAELVSMLRAKGVECLIYDNGEVSRARAMADGYEVIRDLDLDLPLIVAAGQNQIPILASLNRPAFSYVEAFYAMDLIGYGPARAFTDGIPQQMDALYEIYSFMDPDSAAVFLEVLLYRRSLNVERLTRQSPMSDMWRPPVEGLDIRSFCDIGAYDGDSLAAMKAVFPHISRSFTVEPNPELAGAIAAVAGNNGITNRNFSGAAWNRRTRLSARRLSNGMLVIEETDDGPIPADALDALLGGEQYDYVKMDVEGTERAVLEGARNTLRKARCIAVAAYHLPNDFTEVRAQLDQLLGPPSDSGWRLSFAHYSQVWDDSIFYVWRPA